MPNLLAQELNKLAKMLEGAKGAETTYLWKYKCAKGHEFLLSDPHGPSTTPPKRILSCPFDKSVAEIEKPVKRHRCRIDSSAVLEEKPEE